MMLLTHTIDCPCSMSDLAIEIENYLDTIKAQIEHDFPFIEMILTEREIARAMNAVTFEQRGPDRLHIHLNFMPKFEKRWA